MFDTFVTEGYYIHDGERDATNVYFIDEDGRTGKADFFIAHGCTIFLPSLGYYSVGKVSIVFLY